MSAKKWRVCSSSYFGFEHWQVYKLKSVCAADISGNRLYKGGIFDTESDAQKYADLLNEYGVEIDE